MAKHFPLNTVAITIIVPCGSKNILEVGSLSIRGSASQDLDVKLGIPITSKPEAFAGAAETLAG